MLVCWRLDRLGRNLKHLITLLEDLQALGVAFVSLGEGIDATTPAGKLQMHILGAIAEFERGRIVERVRAGPGAGQGARQAPRPAALRDCGRAVRGGRRSARCATPPWRSASAARSCTAGGCHANPSQRRSKPSRFPQGFRWSRRDLGCHADSWL